MQTEQQDQALESCSQRIEEALTTVRFLKHTQKETTKKTLEQVNLDLLSISQSEALREMGVYMMALRLSNPDVTIRENRHSFYAAIKDVVVNDDMISDFALCVSLNLIAKGQYLGRSRELARMVCFTASAIVYAEYVEAQHLHHAVIILDDDEPTEEQLQELAAYDEENAKLSQEAISADQEDSVSE